MEQKGNRRGRSPENQATGDTQATVVLRVDRRLKVALREGAQTFLHLKEVLESIHGPLTMDEFVMKIPAYMDVTAKNDVTWAQGELTTVVQSFKKRGLATEAEMTELFACLVVDVMVGKVTSQEAIDAIEYAGAKK